MPHIERVWEWQFAGSPELLWPVLADTARFNEAMGLPRYAVSETPQPDGSVRRVGSTRRLGMTINWDEGVPEWAAPHRFTHRRRFHGGPLRQLINEITLEPVGAAGATQSRVRYRIAMEPRYWPIGRMLRLSLFGKFGERVDRLFREAADFAMTGQEIGFRSAPDVPPAIRERIAARSQTLRNRGYVAAERLADYLIEASDTELERIRPRSLARQWTMNPREVIETCLGAARGGLLVLRWDLLCPRCRGAKATVSSLDELPQGAHCPSCNISFDRDFSRNVEATFNPSPDIRTVADGAFCVVNPIAADHIKLQHRLPPGSGAVVSAQLPDGDYRARTVELGGTCDFRVENGVVPQIVLTEGDPETGPPDEPGKVNARNATTLERTLVIEDRRWAAEALTAHEVTTMQAFRDLFGASVLRPGDQVEIGRVTLMFTDLKGSSELYNRVGDAQAYAWVREHFAVLARAVRLNNGAIVKTIGDAVMAAFNDPVDALEAAVAIRDDITEFNQSLSVPANLGDVAIIVKLGLHCGPCIAVTLNDRLDYFGRAVNLAARLEGQSRGGDIVLSAALAREPGVAGRLQTLGCTEEQALVKGFADPVTLLRVPAPF